MSDRMSPSDFREPIIQDYVYVDPTTGDLQLLVPIVSGGEGGIGADNTCKTGLELQKFFGKRIGDNTNSARNQLTRYKDALQYDISLLETRGRRSLPVYAEKQRRLASVNAYINVLQRLEADGPITAALNGGFPGLPPAMLAMMHKSDNNLLSILLSPRTPDGYTRLPDTVCSFNRPDNNAIAFGLAFDGVANRLRNSFDRINIPAYPGPKEVFINRFITGRATPRNPAEFATLVSDLNRELRALSGIPALDVGSTQTGTIIDRHFLDLVAMRDPITDPLPPILEDVTNIIDSALTDQFWDGLGGEGQSPFSAIIAAYPNANTPGIGDPAKQARTEKLSIATQFFFAQINMYCYANSISTINFGQILEGNPVLRDRFIVAINDAINNRRDVEDSIINFINNNRVTFGLNRQLSTSDSDELKRNFIDKYNKIKESPHFDEFLFFLPNKDGIAVSHKNLIAVDFASFCLAGHYETPSDAAFLREKSSQYRRITRGKKILDARNEVVRDIGTSRDTSAVILHDLDGAVPVVDDGRIFPADYVPIDEAAILTAATQAVIPTSHVHTAVGGDLPINYEVARSAGIVSIGPYRSTINIPSVPVIMPYHPDGSDYAHERIDQGRARFSFTSQLPRGTITNLPPGACHLLAANGISINNIDCFLSFQNQPWQGEQLLLRPHPWLQPAAAEIGAYTHNDDIRVSVAEVGRSFGPLARVTAQTHDGVFSPNNMAIQGLEDHTHTQTFYSICINPATGRAAVTCHCLLNDADQTVVQQSIAQLQVAGPGALTTENLQALISAEQTGIPTQELNYFLLGGRDPLEESPPSRIVLAEQTPRYRTISTARANSQRLLEAIAAAASSERVAVIERMISTASGGFDLSVVDRYSHNVLFYAQNYGFGSSTVATLERGSAVVSSELVDPGTARANSQRLLEAIAAVSSSERAAVIEGMVSTASGGFDLSVVDRYEHNVLFYAQNYGCSASVMEQLRTPLPSAAISRSTTLPPRTSGTTMMFSRAPSSVSTAISPRANAERLLEAIAAANPRERAMVITQAVTTSQVGYDLTVADQYGHNVLFYAQNYSCSSTVITQLQGSSRFTRPPL